MLPLKEEFDLLDFEVVHRQGNTFCLARERNGITESLVLTFWDQGSEMYCGGSLEGNGKKSTIKYQTVSSVIRLLTASLIMENVMDFHKPKRVRKKPAARQETEVS